MTLVVDLRDRPAAGSRSGEARRPLGAAPIGSSVLGAVRYDGPGGRARFAAALSHLAALYSPLLPDGRIGATWDAVSGTGLVVVGGDVGPGGVCWGCPVGAAGEASPAELHELVERPASARSLLGFWVVAAWHGSGLRIVTTAEPVHAIERVDGAGATAWATKGLAAHALAGVRPALDDAAIPELVLFDFVLGDRELLAATRVEERAAVVDVDAVGWRSWCHWPIEERFAPGPTTSPRELRAALGGLSRRVAAMPDVVLGLTAGRDSTLLASCIAEQGGRVDTFTMGHPAWPDVVGGAAVAAALGWSHRHLEPAASEPLVPSLEPVLRWSAWSEGLDLARNLVGPPLAPLSERPVVFLTGLGGEAGRGLYWTGDGSTPPLEQLLSHRRVLQGAHHDRLEERVREALVRAERAGRTGRSLLDVFYVEERMRKWLFRSRPTAWIGGVLAAYLCSDVLAVLLDLPEEGRASGSCFDRARALGEPPLGDVLRRASPPPRRPSLVDRAVGRLRRAPRAGPSDEVRMVAGLLDELPAGTERSSAALGPGALERLCSDAAQHPSATGRLWNVLAVEALALSLEALPWPSAGSPSPASISGR